MTALFGDAPQLNILRPQNFLPEAFHPRTLPWLKVPATISKLLFLFLRVRILGVDYLHTQTPYLAVLPPLGPAAMSEPSADEADKAGQQDRMKLTACPRCSKPLSEFSRIYNLLYHIDHCEATEPWVNRAELEACPRCSKPCTEFGAAGAFYNHMKNCKETKQWQPDLRKNLTACPRCSKPRSEFTESFGFNQHMEYCKATEQWKPDPRKDLKVCPRCSKPADRFCKRSAFNTHISQCKATKQWVDKSPAEPSTQPAEQQPAEQQPLPAKKPRRPAPEKPQLREITEDMTECPSCHRAASSFLRPDLFQKHAEACDETPGDRSYLTLVDLEECPQCLKPKSGFNSTNPGIFYHHVRYCTSAPDHDAEPSMLNALTECPSCLRKAEEFYHSGAFRAHVRKCEMTPDQVAWTKQVFAMEECPWCLKSSAAFTQRSAFYEHIRKCTAAPDPNSSDMGRWVECPRCHQTDSEFQGRPDFYQHILDCMSSENAIVSDNWQSLFSTSEDELLRSSNAAPREELVWDVLTGASCTTELASPCLELETSRESYLSVDEHVKQEQLVWDLAVPMAPEFYEPLEAGLHGPDDLSSRTDDPDARLQEKRDSHLCDATLTCTEPSPCPIHHRK